MLTRLRTTTPAAQLPVDVNLARRHLRSLQNNDDDLLELYLQTATSQAESYLNRTLVTTSYCWTMSDTHPPMLDVLSATPLVIVPLAISFNGIGTLNRMIEIPRGPVQSVTSVIAGVWDGADVTLVQGTDYSLDLQTDPPRLRFDQPITNTMYDHFAINYTAGYSPNPDLIPAAIKHAILLMACQSYEHRGDDEFSIPTGFYRLLDPFRLTCFPAA